MFMYMYILFVYITHTHTHTHTICRWQYTTQLCRAQTSLRLKCAGGPRDAPPIESPHTRSLSLSSPSFERVSLCFSLSHLSFSSFSLLLLLHSVSLPLSRFLSSFLSSPFFRALSLFISLSPSPLEHRLPHTPGSKRMELRVTGRGGGGAVSGCDVRGRSIVIVLNLHGREGLIALEEPYYVLLYLGRSLHLT